MTSGDLVDPGDFPEESGPGDTLNAQEGTDSDELHNDDGDVVVDPPEGWSEADKFGMTAREAKEGEPLDARLAAEVPDVSESEISDDDADDALPGRAHRGQVSGAPEDGDSLYEVVDEQAE
ncbi:hypothetical protein GAN17_01665 [Mycobacterium kubicae]|uniref:hypothetical protein n=1 Tax=Mycobacterium kubicae TaxID=120959 RepID=UPI00163EC199|nr:hypothetical protein [Mycobacterium kubicae]QNI05153.1 hypothetical protein GAN17_01665 [Mycobacterium kubicae]